jgi:hypothetical protein
MLGFGKQECVQVFVIYSFLDVLNVSLLKINLWSRWYVPVVPATQEVEADIQGQPGQHSNTLSQKQK